LVGELTARRDDTFGAVLRQAIREYIEFDYVPALQAYRATEATLRHLEDHQQAAADFVGANFVREAIAKAKTLLPLPRSEPAKGAAFCSKLMRDPSAQLVSDR
jgi:hypothetical protein